jgi:hypothetical protein
MPNLVDSGNKICIEFDTFLNSRNMHHARRVGLGGYRCDRRHVGGDGFRGVVALALKPASNVVTTSSVSHDQVRVETASPKFSLNSSEPLAMQGASIDDNAVQMQQIEGEIRQPVRPALGHGVVQPVDVGDAAIVGNSDLTIEHHRPAGDGKLSEGRAEHRCVVEPLAAQQLQPAAPVDDGDQAPSRDRRRMREEGRSS